MGKTFQEKEEEMAISLKAYSQKWEKRQTGRKEIAYKSI